MLFFVRGVMKRSEQKPKSENIYLDIINIHTKLGIIDNNFFQKKLYENKKMKKN